MAIVQDKKTGKILEGSRPLGRPKGSRNKLRLSEVMVDCDKLSIEALEMLVKVMRDQVKGATVSQRMSAAVKILDLAYKNKTDAENAGEGGKAVGDLMEETWAPAISLKALA